jgi:hypothetical protein
VGVIILETIETRDWDNDWGPTIWWCNFLEYAHKGSRSYYSVGESERIDKALAEFGGFQHDDIHSPCIKIQFERDEDAAFFLLRWS